MLQPRKNKGIASDINRYLIGEVFAKSTLYSFNLVLIWLRTFCLRVKTDRQNVLALVKISLYASSTPFPSPKWPLYKVIDGPAIWNLIHAPRPSSWPNRKNVHLINHLFMSSARAHEVLERKNWIEISGRCAVVLIFASRHSAFLAGRRERTLLASQPHRIPTNKFTKSHKNQSARISSHVISRPSGHKNVCLR